MLSKEAILEMAEVILEILVIARGSKRMLAEHHNTIFERYLHHTTVDRTESHYDLTWKVSRMMSER
jgi:hypothetical protein